MLPVQDHGRTIAVNADIAGSDVVVAQHRIVDDDLEPRSVSTLHTEVLANDPEVSQPPVGARPLR